MPTQFSQFIQGGLYQQGDQVVGLRNQLNTIFTLQNGGSVPVIQIGHGFLVGQLVYISGPSTFALANANTLVTSNVIGMVVQVIDANNFVLQYIGLTPAIVQIPPGIPLVPGTVYFLSDAVAGAYTAVAPVTVGHVRKPVFIAFTTTTAFIFNWQGNVL